MGTERMISLEERDEMFRQVNSMAELQELVNTFGLQITEAADEYEYLRRALYLSFGDDASYFYNPEFFRNGRYTGVPLYQFMKEQRGYFIVSSQDSFKGIDKSTLANPLVGGNPERAQDFIDDRMGFESVEEGVSLDDMTAKIGADLLGGLVVFRTDQKLQLPR